MCLATLFVSRVRSPQTKPARVGSLILLKSAAAVSPALCAQLGRIKVSKSSLSVVQPSGNDHPPLPSRLRKTPARQGLRRASRGLPSPVWDRVHWLSEHRMQYVNSYTCGSG